MFFLWGEKSKQSFKKTDLLFLFLYFFDGKRKGIPVFTDCLNLPGKVDLDFPHLFIRKLQFHLLSAQQIVSLLQDIQRVLQHRDVFLSHQVHLISLASLAPKRAAFTSSFMISGCLDQSCLSTKNPFV